MKKPIVVEHNLGSANPDREDSFEVTSTGLPSSSRPSRPSRSTPFATSPAGLRGLVSFAAGATIAVLACAKGEDPATEPSPIVPDAGEPDVVEIEAGGPIFEKNDGGGVAETTCEFAAAEKSYIGCDYWPTVVSNSVWTIFDFAVVVANAGNSAADVVVTGPNGVNTKVSVPGGGLSKIFLPWVEDLKGNAADGVDSCGNITPLAASIRSKKGAYHLVSSRPVSVYQFNPLEYAGKGGPAGKDWSECPGSKPCSITGLEDGCFSFSNDASLLLPSTALTGNYRITGQRSESIPDRFNGGEVPYTNGYFAVTGLQDGTTVVVKVGPKGAVLAGPDIAATAAGETLTFTLDAGDVVELVGEPKTSSDLSGSLVQADKPVQVITGVPCITHPAGAQACDHIEESVFPAETLGKDYFVAVPTGPNAEPIGHIVRFYGNVDGTKLTYAGDKPTNAPDTINAGDVVDLEIVKKDFRVIGTESFGVGMFMLGGTLVDPAAPDGKKMGDPSQSLATAVEQYRTRYIFLAPDDYDVSYVDIIHPDETKLQLDGIAVTAPPKSIASGFAITRLPLGPGKEGAHELVATKPVGIQVLGYGFSTSYQYPGGLDLKVIAPPPIK